MNEHDYDMITIMIWYESCVSLCIKIRLRSYTIDDLRFFPDRPGQDRVMNKLC